jgi:GH43 family beta-xylosidase
LTYVNPVWPHSFPDPFVLKFRGEYWGYCTGFWTDGRCFGVIRSLDLVHWEPMSGAMEPLPGGHTCYWAPEVTYDNGHFYLYYSVGNEELMEIRVAVSEHPAGPFMDSGRRLTSEPFAIDAHVFLDDDGSRHFFYATDFLDRSHIGTGTVRDRMLDPFTLAGEPVPVTLPRHDWHVYHPIRPEKGYVRWHTVEGPFVLKHEGLYYQMFSGGNWQNPTYGVSYATARGLDEPGDWKQAADGERVLPILRTTGEVVGPGHNSVVRGPDNRQLYCVYHRWSPDLSARVMAIDPLDWAGERMLVLGPTNTPRPGPVPPTISDLVDMPAVLVPGEEIRYDTGAPSFLVEVSVRMEEGAGLAIVLRGEAFRIGQDLAPGIIHLLRLEVDGPALSLSVDGAAPWRGSAGGGVTSLAFAAEGGAVELYGFALTVGWEDLYLKDGDPAESGWEVLDGTGGWRIESGRLRHSAERMAWIAKGPPLVSWLAVVNARLEGEGCYGFGADPGPRILLERSGKDWILGAGEQILPLPATFDPSIDQQFRLRKIEDRLEIAWEGIDLGAIQVPSGAARLQMGAAGGSASFEAARLTAVGVGEEGARSGGGELAVARTAKGD